MEQLSTHTAAAIRQSADRAVKERPIIFSAPMVHSLLTNRKTQTRRVIKHILPETRRCAPHDHVPASFWFYDRFDRPLHLFPCPYGQPGDRLWVKETHGFGGNAYTPELYFRATEPDAPIRGNWKSSLFMRREHSRITLEILSIRAELLQQITEADAKAEGIYQDQAGRLTTWSATPDAKERLNPVAAYRDLWESISGEGSWEANPFVWVVEFSRIF